LDVLSDLEKAKTKCMEEERLKLQNEEDRLAMEASNWTNDMLNVDIDYNASLTSNSTVKRTHDDSELVRTKRARNFYDFWGFDD
jgi:hypothetical protein